MDLPQLGSFTQEVLLNAFRTHYHRFQAAITDLVGTQTDAIVISRLGDDLDEFADIVTEATIFPPEEFTTLETNGPGRPRIYIDPDFLRWAYGQRSTASISRFLGVGRTTMRNALIAHGIVEPQQNPFQQADDSLDTAGPSDGDDILDPDLPIPPTGSFPPEVAELAASSQPTTSFTGPLSDISDDDLDMLLLRLRTHYRRAGLSMLNGMLRRLGHRVPIERIRQSLLQIDPVRRIFERIRIQRRDYCVLGPNSLWHHDGQHDTFPPKRKLISISAFRSVHNVRIERLWVDVTAQVGATWGDHFTLLEVRYGLDINNLDFFAQSWNQHRIQIRNSPNRSPTDMFVFDMYVNGVRGDQLPAAEENFDEEELEVYGIDWQGLRDDGVLRSQAQNNSHAEGSSSWVGRTGPPPDLSQVIVQPPMGTLTDEEIFKTSLESVINPDLIRLINKS
ncbi:hypothetical protein K438DRAFT_1912022 [Mycena galopus ATCC 62051]|nr:hypothetical protein K438DRAFT_1912022 [Mycena galopus ATCC 62051]